MTRFFLTILTIMALFSAPVFAQTETAPQPSNNKARLKIGLVLGGGGARGLAHVGVIKMLEDNQIPIDVVTGTSMGAIIGSLYASGYSADELAEVTSNLDWNDVFNDKTSRSRATFRRKSDEFGFLTDYKLSFKDGKVVLPKGLIQGQNLFLELSRLLVDTRGIGRFEDLPIPFRLVATDLSTGKPIVLTDGDLASAVFASMAIPGFLPPVEREGKLLIDGGISNNVPVNLARQLGADIVIVVNVGSEPKPAEEIGNFIDVLRQTQLILTQSTTDYQISTMGRKDVLIEPKLDGLSATSFGQSDALVTSGNQAARSVIDKLSSLRLNDLQWAMHLQGRVKGFTHTPVIDRIEVVQNSKLSDEIIRTGVHIKSGATLDPKRLNSDIDRLYGIGIFDKITYKVREDDAENVLEISANAKETSDGYFKFGVSLDSDLESDTEFQFGISYTKPQLNRWGGEWRTELNFGNSLEAVSEFYQPLGAKQRFFVEPSVFFVRDRRDFFTANDQRRGDVKIFALGASLQGGVLFGRWGELRAGIVKSRFDINFTDEALNVLDLKIDDSYALTQFTIDTLDSLSFPTQGGLLIAGYEVHDSFLGGDTEYKQVSINAFKPMTFGRHTFAIGGRYGGASGRESSNLGTTDLGGFLSLAGFGEGELDDRYAALLVGSYYYRLNREAPVFDTPLFIGASIEAGNVFSSFDAISAEDAILAGSLFAGMKSPIGPIFVGVGTNDEGKTALYFSIGSFF